MDCSMHFIKEIYWWALSHPKTKKIFRSGYPCSILHTSLYCHCRLHSALLQGSLVSPRLSAATHCSQDGFLQQTEGWYRGNGTAGVSKTSRENNNLDVPLYLFTHTLDPWFWYRFKIFWLVPVYQFLMQPSLLHLSLQQFRELSGSNWGETADYSGGWSELWRT